MASRTAGPAYCMAVTVYSSCARSMVVSSWAAIARVQSSVTVSAGVSGPGSIASASLRNCVTSARQARTPSGLSSGTRSSYPGMPDVVAAKGLASSQR